MADSTVDPQQAELDLLLTQESCDHRYERGLTAVKGKRVYVLICQKCHDTRSLHRSDGPQRSHFPEDDRRR